MNSHNACDFSEQIKEKILSSNKFCTFYSSDTTTATFREPTTSVTESIRTTPSVLSTTATTELKFTQELINDNSDNFIINSKIDEEEEFDLFDSLLSAMENVIRSIRKASKKSKNSNRYLLRNS